MLDNRQRKQTRLSYLSPAAFTQQYAVTILKVLAMERDFINGYQAGSWGSRGTYHLFDRDDDFWRHSLNPNVADLQAY